MVSKSNGRPHIRFKVEFENCPVEASLGVLGRKWALLVLRDIGLFGTQRYNEILRATPGMTKRVLSLRLSELERDGLIFREERAHRYTRWALTPKGEDVLPILMTLVQFGAAWSASRVFADGKPRSLSEVFDVADIRRILGPQSVDNQSVELDGPLPASTRRSERIPPVSVTT